MRRGDFKRWMYRGNSPHRLARVLNRGWATVGAAGVSPDWLVTLEVVGRRSGHLYSFPVVMADYEGDRYLVAMLGEEANWVHNVRAAGGRAVMRHGRREPVHLDEVPVEARAPIIRRYLERAPGARPHIPLDPGAPIEEFESLAPSIPVFRVTAREWDPGESPPR